MIIESSHAYISSCRIRHFKSFGAIWTELAFSSPHLVGIVGPNGSGKSNLLEALQFAAGASATELRVKTLKELCNNSGADQLCEVEFSIARQGAPPSTKANWSCAAPQPRVLACIRAALKPDGTRSFQIDGKHKTAAQVKEFLRAQGVCLQNPSVIRQATVTRLANTNSSEDIAAIIANASGLSRWNQETARAMAELRGARESLLEIKNNVAKLRQLISQDDQRLASLEHARKIHDTILELSTSLACTYRQQQAAASASAAAMSTEILLLQDQTERLQEHLKSLDQEQLIVHADAAPSGKNSGRRQGYHPSVVSLLQEQGILEDKVRHFEARLQEAQEHAAEYAACTAQLQQLQKLADAQALGLQDLETRAQELDARVAEAEGAIGCIGLHAADIKSRAEDMLQTSLANMEKAKSTQKWQEDELERVKAELRTARSLHTSMEQQVTAQGKATPEAMASIPALSARLEQTHNEIQDLQTAHQETQVRIQVLQAGMGIVNAGTKGAKQCGQGDRQSFAAAAREEAAPAGKACQLHEMFEFAVPRGHQEGVDAAGGAHAGQYHSSTPHNLCRALAVIGGSSLHVVVVPDSAAAKRILDCPGLLGHAGSQQMGQAHDRRVLRIWPLDRITSSDSSAEQRRAQAELGADRVILPLDLFQFDPRHKAAMLRAFGGSVIAMDSDTAAKLASRYNLGSVTPDGTVSKRGTVSGGYRGRGLGAGESPAELLLQQKLELAQLQALRHNQELRLKDAAAEVKSLDAQLAAAHGCMERAEQQAQALAASKMALQQLQAHYEGALEGLRLACAQTQHADASVARHNSLLTACQKSLGGPDGIAAHQEQALNEENAHQRQAVQANLEDLQQQCQATLAKQQALLERQQGLSLQLGIEEQPEGEAGAAGDEDHSRAVDLRLADLASLLSEQQRQLLGVKQQMAAAEAMKQAEHKQRQEQEAKRQALACKRQALQEEARALQHDLASKERKLQELQNTYMQHQRALDQLYKEFPKASLAPKQALPPNFHGLTVPSDQPEGMGTVDVTSMCRRLEVLRKELKSLDNMQMSVVEQAQYTERRDSVRLFEERWHALASGSDVLEAGIKDSHSKVLRTHSQVLHAISHRFEATAAALLPSLEFRLGTSDHAGVHFGLDQLEAHDGATIQFRHVKAAGALSWSQNLEELSGGQRTLVSLSLVLAAACEGSRSSVLLMDEVDAALDEHNQSLVADLCCALAHGQLRGPKRTPSHSAAGTLGTGNTSACMQLVCVSHHAAFQRACDALVKVSLQDGGTHICS